MRFYPVFLSILLLPFPVLAQVSGKRDTVRAYRTNMPIKIDGYLNEKAWKNAPVITGFRQQEPHEGQPATERTVVRVLYDNNAIYIGAKMYDTAPDSIIARLGRRDTYQSSDRFRVYIDPYHDRQTGFYFGVDAAGTIYDGILFNDYDRDDSWDGVWEGKAHIDSTGWTVEMRIPYSQLRFQKMKKYVWGIDFEREIPRRNEDDYLVYPPKKVSGFVSLFPNLIGIKNIDPPTDLEIIPYITSKASYLRHAPGDPFNNGSKYNFNAGADVRTAIGSNLTVNATINPDFGQVEVDPAIVNLSDVETFYPEKRPFFIEGSNFFDFGNGGNNINLNLDWPSPTFFYSRRIGQRPQGSVPGNADFVNYPEATHIMGAAKVTGRMPGGWNLGFMQALTAQDKAHYSVGDTIKSISVEPLTSYTAARVQKQFNEGRQGLGVMTTFAERTFERPELRNEINHSAGFTGIDGYTLLDQNRSWVLTGWLGASHITGTPQRMVALQTDPVHYFQRPDARHYHVDSTATSLNGYGGHLIFAKQGGQFVFYSSLGMLSPGFDLNDMGYLARSNLINLTVGPGYQWTVPTSWYQYMLVATAYFSNHDFDGNATERGTWNHLEMQFKNFSAFNLNVITQFKTYNDRLTRGGPLTISKGGYDISSFYSTNDNKPLSFKIFVDYNHSRDHSNSWTISPGITWKPVSKASFSFSPEYDWNSQNAHYIGTFVDPFAIQTFGNRYVFANLDQHTISASIRINWTFTPELSLQMYIQPLVSSGTYSNYKQLQRPKSYDFLTYGQGGSTFNPLTHIADPDGSGPARPIDLGNPDFTFRSLRGDAILRWQFRPGSTIYFVWTQSRSHTLDTGQFHPFSTLSDLLGNKPNNIFLVKFSYWFNL